MYQTNEIVSQWGFFYRSKLPSIDFVLDWRDHTIGHKRFADFGQDRSQRDRTQTCCYIWRYWCFWNRLFCKMQERVVTVSKYFKEWGNWEAGVKNPIWYAIRTRRFRNTYIRQYFVPIFFINNELRMNVTIANVEVQSLLSRCIDVSHF